MRVIGGKLKGRRLVSFKADHIRPTTDRVKETLFNMLAGDVPEARILDLFAGTGNLSIECVSRGAKYVEAVELSKASILIIRENLAALKIEKSVVIRQADVFQYLSAARGEPFDLVFVDPPFTEKIAHDCMEALAKSRVCRDGGVVIIEAGTRERIEDEYGPFKLLDRREFGDKSASLYRKEIP